MAVGGLLDLDDMLGGSANAGPSGLGGIDLGGVVAQTSQPAPSNDMGFGFGTDAGQGQAQAPAEESDWANAFGGDSSDASPAIPVAFAKP